MPVTDPGKDWDFYYSQAYRRETFCFYALPPEDKEDGETRGGQREEEGTDLSFSLREGTSGAYLQARIVLCVLLVYITRCLHV